LQWVPGNHDLAADLISGLKTGSYQKSIFLNNLNMTEKKRNLSPEKRLAYLNSKKKQLIETCTACGKCLRQCPIFTRGKYKEEKPRSIMLSVLDLLQTGTFSAEAEYTALTCTNCGDCTARCPEKIIPLLIFRAAAEKLSEIGRNPERVSDFSYFLGNLQLEDPDVKWIDEGNKGPESVDVVLFPGCDSIRTPNEILTYIDILERMELKFVTLWSKDLCCGFKGYSMNDFEKGDRLAKNLISSIEAIGAKKVLLPCGQCYNTFNRTLSKLFSLPFEIIYFPKYLCQEINRLGFVNKINKTITIHDSCKIARAVKDFDTLRELMKELPGIKLVEMEKNREKSICCGGVNNFSYPELTARLVKHRLDQAREVKADLLVTDCTLCYSIYSIVEDSYPFEVRHYSSLVAEAMGIEEREDRYKKILHMERDSIKETIMRSAKVLGKTSEWEMDRELDTFTDIVRRLRMG
jgi:heterodisulfide reductase subunit D